MRGLDVALLVVGILLFCGVVLALMVLLHRPLVRARDELRAAHPDAVVFVTKRPSDLNDMLMGNRFANILLTVVDGTGISLRLPKTPLEEFRRIDWSDVVSIAPRDQSMVNESGQFRYPALEVRVVSDDRADLLALVPCFDLLGGPLQLGWGARFNNYADRITAVWQRS